jgi:hypothetical protein
MYLLACVYDSPEPVYWSCLVQLTTIMGGGVGSRSRRRGRRDASLSRRGV